MARKILITVAVVYALVASYPAFRASVIKLHSDITEVTR